MLLPLILSFSTASVSVVQQASAPEAPLVQVDLSGHWEGTIQIAGLDFDVDLVHDRAGELAGDFSIPSQAITDLPLLDPLLEGDRLTFALPDEIPGEARFEGTVEPDGERVGGTFHQGGARLRFSMERAEDPLLAAAASLEGFEEWMVEQLEDFRVPGATVAVVYRDQVILAEGYGIRNAGTEEPATAGTVFAIGSTTKAFTAFALAQAVERGELDWEEPARRYLPELDLVDEYAESHLTLREMVSHLSGLPRHDLSWYLFPDKSRAELVASLAHLEPSAELRQTWQYNNLMFLAAGVALERVTGRSWEANLRQGILEPLGMADTVFGPGEAAARADHAVAHDRRKGKSVVIPFRDITQIGPAGSIHSSARDMAQWIRCQLGGGSVGENELLGTASYVPLVTPIAAIPQLVAQRQGSPLSYAMGWMIDNHRGHLRIHHDGGIDGFVTSVQLFPGDSLGLFVSTNRSSSLPAVVAGELLERILELEPQDAAGAAVSQMETTQQFASIGEQGATATRIEGAPPAHDLADYAGEYRHPGYGSVTVTLEDSELRVALGTFAGVLEPWHYEVFRAEEASGDDAIGKPLLQFETDLAGYVSALRCVLEPAVDPIRFERQPDAGLASVEYLDRLVGNYRIATQRIEVRRESDRLVMEVSGQPPYTLEPWTHGRFRLAEVDGFSVRFREEGGAVTGLLLYQPQGNFVAERESREDEAPPSDS